MIGGRLTRAQRGALIAAALVSGVGAVVSAHAGLVRDTTAAAAPAPVSQGYEAEDHFPGAALLYADEPAPAAPPAPAPGATGTIALPDVPVPAAIVGDESIRPAAPFVLRGTPLDRERALQCLTTAIYYEAASEPDAGQAAVAQVILNRVRHPAFASSVCGVVYQGSERRGCQFSFACDGSMARVPMRSAYERARRAAWSALNGTVFAPVGMATHYHTYAVTPSWGRTLVMTGVFGAHFFHRWKGWWGTPAAFRQAYVGNEPVPGPHTPVDLPGAAPVIAAPLIAAVVPAGIKGAPGTRPLPTPAANIVPAYRDSGMPQPAYSARELPESTILDRWKDTGKPLR